MKRRHTAVPAVLCGMLAVAFASAVSAEIFEGYPDIIVCDVGTQDATTGQLVFYVEARVAEGGVIYRPLVATADSLTVGKDGVIESEKRPGCSGRSLKQLKSESRAFDIVDR